jgi:TolB protein
MDALWLVACVSLTMVLAVPTMAEAGRLRVLIRDQRKVPVWARLEVRDTTGQMYQPPESAQVIRDRTAHDFPGTKPYYTGHFVACGEVTLEVPVGEYTVIAERGLEYTRAQSRVAVRAGNEARVEVSPQRWVDMNQQGWWSADFHVHRPIDEVPALLQAEDVNLAAVITMWTARNLWQGRNPLPDPVLRVDPRHFATLMNAEDERGGGAWMLLNLKRTLLLGADGRWFPQGKVFADQARAQGAWFDSEKPIWWEVPVMMAVAQPDSLGVVNNHIQQYGIYAEEAWGRPRDLKQFPGPEGFVAYCLDLYYKYLNLGFKLPVSAGSASGVVGNPLGQNRVYAYLGSASGFDPDKYYAAMRRGRTFATNGPMLILRLNGRLPGDTIKVLGEEAVTCELEASAREPVSRIEFVANGDVVDTWTPGSTPIKKVKLSRKLNLAGHTWLAARCFLAPGETIRLAHTSPVYLSGPEARWDARQDARYFLKWLDELTAVTKSEKDRFKDNAERREVLAIYSKARAFYARLAP